MTPRIKLLFILAGPIAAVITLFLFVVMIAIGAESELLKFDGDLKWERGANKPPEIHFEFPDGTSSQFVFPKRCWNDTARSEAVWWCFREFLDELIATHPTAKEILKKHEIEYKKG